MLSVVGRRWPLDLSREPIGSTGAGSIVDKPSDQLREARIVMTPAEAAEIAAELEALEQAIADLRSRCDRLTDHFAGERRGPAPRQRRSARSLAEPRHEAP